MVFFSEPEADRPSHCIYLQELSESLRGQDWLDLDTIQQVGIINI